MNSNDKNNNVKTYPAPWALKGKGYILLYRFSKKEIQKDPFLSQKFKDSFLGGFGAVMIVDYQKSNAGPYQELLFIPGNFSYNEQKKKTISKIYVSTKASVTNGIINWAIPKKLAKFTFKDLDTHKETIHVFSEEKEILNIKIKSGRFPFPVHTTLLPFPLVQERNDKAYYTTFSGSGIGYLAKIMNLSVNNDMFPKIIEKKPFLCIKVDPFNIYFPKSTIKEID